MMQQACSTRLRLVVNLSYASINSILLLIDLSLPGEAKRRDAHCCFSLTTIKLSLKRHCLSCIT